MGNDRKDDRSVLAEALCVPLEAGGVEEALRAARGYQMRYRDVRGRRVVEALELLMSEVWLGAEDGAHPGLTEASGHLAVGALAAALEAYDRVLSERPREERAARLAHRTRLVLAAVTGGELPAPREAPTAQVAPGTGRPPTPVSTLSFDDPTVNVEPEVAEGFASESTRHLEIGEYEIIEDDEPEAALAPPTAPSRETTRVAQPGELPIEELRKQMREEAGGQLDELGEADADDALEEILGDLEREVPDPAPIPRAVVEAPSAPAEPSLVLDITVDDSPGWTGGEDPAAGWDDEETASLESGQMAKLRAAAASREEKVFRDEPRVPVAPVAPKEGPLPAAPTLDELPPDEVLGPAGVPAAPAPAAAAGSAPPLPAAPPPPAAAGSGPPPPVAPSPPAALGSVPPLPAAPSSAGGPPVPPPPSAVTPSEAVASPEVGASPPAPPVPAAPSAVVPVTPAGSPAGSGPPVPSAPRPPPAAGAGPPLPSAPPPPGSAGSGPPVPSAPASVGSGPPVPSAPPPPPSAGAGPPVPSAPPPPPSAGAGPPVPSPPPPSMGSGAPTPSAPPAAGAGLAMLPAPGSGPPVPSAPPPPAAGGDPPVPSPSGIGAEAAPAAPASGLLAPAPPVSVGARPPIPAAPAPPPAVGAGPPVPVAPAPPPAVGAGPPVPSAPLPPGVGAGPAVPAAPRPGSSGAGPAAPAAPRLGSPAAGPRPPAGPPVPTAPVPAAPAGGPAVPAAPGTPAPSPGATAAPESLATLTQDAYAPTLPLAAVPRAGQGPPVPAPPPPSSAGVAPLGSVHQPAALGGAVASEGWEIREPGGSEPLPAHDPSWIGVRIDAVSSDFEAPEDGAEGESWGDVTLVGSDDRRRDAERHVTRGELRDALRIYQELAVEAPDDSTLTERVMEIAAMLQQQSGA